MKRLFFAVLLFVFAMQLGITGKGWAQETATPVVKKTATPQKKETFGKTTSNTQTTTPTISETPTPTTEPVTITSGPVTMTGPMTITTGSLSVPVTQVIIPQSVKIISQSAESASKASVDAKGTSSNAKATASATPDYASQHFFVELGYVSFAPYVLNPPSSPSGNYTLTSNSQVSSLVSASVRFRDVKPWNLLMPGSQENVTHQFSDISMLNFGIAVLGSSPTSIQASNAVDAGNIYGEIFESLDFFTDFLTEVLTLGAVSKDAYSNFSDKGDSSKESLNDDKASLKNASTVPYVWDLGFFYAFNSNRSSLNLMHQIGAGPIGAVALPNGKNPPIELVGGAMLGWSEFPSFIPNSNDNEVSTANGFPSVGLVHSFLAFISCNLPVGSNYLTLDAETATAFDSSFNTWSISLGYTIPVDKLLKDL